MGSPPHTRDKLAKDVGVCRQTRITPAYAGQIRSLWKNVIPKRDHPRIRGTNRNRKRFKRFRTGSPPHTRDKFLDKVNRERETRITPAYAGQIENQNRKTTIRQDHPRIRGTNQNLMCSELLREGSPPHTRDKFTRCFCIFVATRITPAYAGQILLYGKSCRIVWDHPRIRGTNETTEELRGMV